MVRFRKFCLNMSLLIIGLVMLMHGLIEVRCYKFFLLSSSMRQFALCLAMQDLMPHLAGLGPCMPTASPKDFAKSGVLCVLWITG